MSKISRYKATLLLWGGVKAVVAGPGPLLVVVVVAPLGLVMLDEDQSKGLAGTYEVVGKFNPWCVG